MVSPELRFIFGNQRACGEKIDHKSFEQGKNAYNLLNEPKRGLTFDQVKTAPKIASQSLITQTSERGYERYNQLELS